MPKEWYGQIGRVATGNQARDQQRKEKKQENRFIEESSLDANFKALRGNIKETLSESLRSLEQKQINTTNAPLRKRFKAIYKCGNHLQKNGPLVETQNLISVYRNELKMPQDTKTMSLTFFETLSKHLPICQNIGKKAYVIEDRMEEVSIVSAAVDILLKDPYFIVSNYIKNRIGHIYKDAIDFLDTKRDKDVMRAILAKITSVRYAARLEGLQSRYAVRNASDRLEADLLTYSELKKTSQVVRNDMTNEKQALLQRRIAAKRKHKEMRTIAQGRGAILKCKQFPDLAAVMECLFCTEGLETHPRLTDTVLYKSKSNTLTMKHAREALLSLSPNGFSISLSSCYNYTQNYKAGTAQAKRHHDGQDINACISLHNAPRIGVSKLVPNLHWSSANVSSILDSAAEDPQDTLLDSKDAKNIICADISPVQVPGKTWKKRDSVLPDHSWDQSRTNAVTPMTHLFLQIPSPADRIERMFLNCVKVARSGKAAGLINLSLYEPSTTVRALNELLYMMTLPQFDEIFRNSETKRLKKKFIFIVDNGPAEQPSSPLVRMTLIRLMKYLDLKMVCQVAFAEYNSKRNFAERVHALENNVLSKHGPFKSDMLHTNVNAPSDEHNENMEAMAQEVISCISNAQYAGKPIATLRGVKDSQYVFGDERELKQFLSLTEARKQDCNLNYTANSRSDVHKDLVMIWNINRTFEESYLSDYEWLMNTSLSWKDRYTFICIKPSYDEQSIDRRAVVWQPIPDYLRWFSTGELHYLPFERRKLLPAGVWDYKPELFLPSNIIQMAYNVFVNVPESTEEGLAFLTWLPQSELKQALNEQKNVCLEEMRKDGLREKLIESRLYEHNKAKLAKMCLENNLSTIGTKLDLAERLAKHSGVNLDHETPLYVGDLSSIPASVTQIRRLSAAKKTPCSFTFSQCFKTGY